MPRNIKLIPFEAGYIEVLSWGCENSYDLFEQNKIKTKYLNYLKKGIKQSPIGHSALRVVTPKTRSIRNLLSKMPENCISYEEIAYYPTINAEKACPYYEIYFSWWPSFFSLNPYRFNPPLKAATFAKDCEEAYAGSTLPVTQKIGLVDLLYHMKKRFKVIDQTLDALAYDLENYSHNKLAYAPEKQSVIPESRFFISAIHCLNYIDDANLMEVTEVRQQFKDVVTQLMKKKWSTAIQQSMQPQVTQLINSLREIIHEYDKQKHHILESLSKQEAEIRQKIESLTRVLSEDKTVHANSDLHSHIELQIKLLQSRLHGNIEAAAIHTDLANLELELHRLTQLCSNPTILDSQSSSDYGVLTELKKVNQAIRILEKTAVTLHQNKLLSQAYLQGTPPDNTVLIPLSTDEQKARLDVKSMLTEAVKLHQSASYYCLALNCSRSIRKILEAGMSPCQQLPDIFLKRPLIETPQSVQDFAIMLRAHFDSQAMPIETENAKQPNYRKMTIGSIEYYRILLIHRINQIRADMEDTTTAPINYELICQCEAIIRYSLTLLKRGQISRKMADRLGQSCYDLAISPAYSLPQFKQTVKRYHQSKNPVLQLKLLLNDLLSSLLTFLSTAYEQNSLNQFDDNQCQEQPEIAARELLECLKNACHSDDDIDPLSLLGLSLG